MKKKKIMIIMLTITITIGIVLGIFTINAQLANKKSKDLEREKGEKPTTKKENNQISNENSKNQDLGNDSEVINKQIVENNENTSKIEEERTSSDKQLTQNDPPKQQPSPKPNTTNVTDLTPTIPTNPSPTPVQKTPWEELGISEYDYYNKPIYGDDDITFSVKIYGSKEATEEACRKESMRLIEEGVISSCRTVNSYSGNYLGEKLTKH